jgi:hypothetical protein
MTHIRGLPQHETYCHATGSSSQMKPHSLLAQAAADNAVRAAMRGAGATRPKSAAPRKKLPTIPEAHFASALDRGILRETQPGVYYLYERIARPPMSTRRKVARAVIWILVILVPAALARQESWW